MICLRSALAPSRFTSHHQKAEIIPYSKIYLNKLTVRMASATSDRLSLLADHIQLSIQERGRARAVSVEPDNNNTHAISKSLDTLLQGIQQLEVEQGQLEERGEL